MTSQAPVVRQDCNVNYKLKRDQDRRLELAESGEAPVVVVFSSTLNSTNVTVTARA